MAQENKKERPEGVIQQIIGAYWTSGSQPEAFLRCITRWRFPDRMEASSLRKCRSIREMMWCGAFPWDRPMDWCGE